MTKFSRHFSDSCSVPSPHPVSQQRLYLGSYQQSQTAISLDQPRKSFVSSTTSSKKSMNDCPGPDPPRFENLNLHDSSIITTTEAPPIPIGISSPPQPTISRKQPASVNDYDEEALYHNKRPLKSPSPTTSEVKKDAFHQTQPNTNDGNKYANTINNSACDFDSSTAQMSKLHAPLKGEEGEKTFNPHESLPPSPQQAEGDVYLFRQPKTKPITEEQLVNEVQGIYAGLLMVEKKCIEIDQQQLESKNKLSNEQWEALIALHRTLLHEHHDFFLASQHPSASNRLRKLAYKYAMPARMWRYGIHSFLELLRHRLPDSLDHMLAFIYTAYSMMTLLMESVPTFIDTWIECLGDLARYRMAIEEEDSMDRDIWAGVARYWYNKAADKSPNVGRIQHHLAVLARPDILQQLFFYSKSLVCIQPFPNTQDSILLLLNPILDPAESLHRQPLALSFVKAHAICFKKQSILTFLQHARDFMAHLPTHIGRLGEKWREQGVHIASINFAALLEYGQPNGMFIKSIGRILQTPQDSIALAAQDYWMHCNIRQPGEFLPRSVVNATFTNSMDMVSYSSLLASHTLSFVLKQIGDKNVLPHVHLSIAFLWSLALVPDFMIYVESEIPWHSLVTFLNTLNRQGVSEMRIVSNEFPNPEKGHDGICQLPEDFTMRGQIWSQLYYPENVFEDPLVDNEERVLELPDTAIYRVERCLWLGCRIASMDRWIAYDYINRTFSTKDLASELETNSRRETVFNMVPQLLVERESEKEKLNKKKG